MSIPTISTYSMPVNNELPNNKVKWILDKNRVSLLIHDMQDYFLNFFDDGYLKKTLINNIIQIRDFCRLNNIPIFYTAQPKHQSITDRALLNDFWGKGVNQKPEEINIVKELMPLATEKIISKWRYSAFQRSDFQSELISSGRDQLIIVGVYANIGCLATALDAFMRDIKPWMIADALADFSKEEHMMSLLYTASKCGKIATTEEIININN